MNSSSIIFLAGRLPFKKAAKIMREIERGSVGMRYVVSDRRMPQIAGWYSVGSEWWCGRDYTDAAALVNKKLSEMSLTRDQRVYAATRLEDTIRSHLNLNRGFGYEFVADATPLLSIVPCCQRFRVSTHFTDDYEGIF
jgi:hypothetical protein